MAGPRESTELTRALGEAAVRHWSELPQEVQHALFEAVVASHGKPIKQRLAVFLHEKHARTSNSDKTRAILEPDSLGG